MDLPAKRFKKESIVDIEESSPQPRSSVVKSSDDIFISLLDSDDDDADGGSDGGDAIKDKSDVRDSDSDSGVQQMVSTTSAIAVNRVVGAIPPATHSSKEDFVSSEDVSSLWFVREHWHQVVLAGHQLGRDTLLLQVGEPPGNASVKLEVYQWQAGQDREQSVKLVSRLSLPVGGATVCEDPGFIPATLPLPLSIVNHQSGEQIGSWAPSHVISSSFYRQLFGPELALVKLPILLLGAPTGEVFYAPVNNMFAGVSYNVFLGPLFCLSQVVKGIHPIRIHHSDVCDGLVLIGGRGKVLLCLEGRGGERNMHPPRIESLHAGFTVLASCLLSPCLLAIAGMKCVKIVDLTLAIGSPGGHDRNILLQQLHKAFYKASRLEVAEIIRLEPLANASPDERSCVAFDFDGGLSVSDISEKVLDECRSCSTATSSTATVKERIAVKMTKLRQLEGEGEYAAERLEKVEGYIRDVNMALHTAHLLTTGKATAFRVEEVTAIETGRSDSCCLKVSLAYGGQLRLGAGWSFILSASADDTGLHVMQLPEMRHTMDGGDGGDSDGAAHSSVSSLEGMSPGSLCHCYLTLASHTAVRPLLLTCSLQYDAIEAAEYLNREPVNVSAVILKKSLSVLDFMQPVPANVHISSSSQATRRHATGLKSNSNETRTITISRETVYKCVSCTGNHDNKTLLHRFLHVLVGRRDSGLPVQSVGKDDMGLRLVLPDRSIFLLSIKGALGEKQDLYECVCKSHSYNSLMAGTDAVIDHIVSVVCVCVRMCSLSVQC